MTWEALPHKVCARLTVEEILRYTRRRKYIYRFSESFLEKVLEELAKGCGDHKYTRHAEQRRKNGATLF